MSPQGDACLQDVLAPSATAFYTPIDVQIRPCTNADTDTKRSKTRAEEAIECIKRGRRQPFGDEAAVQSRNPGVSTRPGPESWVYSYGAHMLLSCSCRIMQSAPKSHYNLDYSITMQCYTFLPQDSGLAIRISAATSRQHPCGL